LNPVTHLLAGWIIADECKLKGRDKAFVAWSCVIPDIDGIGYIVDFINRILGLPETLYYETYHHNWGHGLFAALITTMVVYSFAIEKKKTVFLAFLTFHLHLLMDLAGSRGSNPFDIWPIPYLAPLSEKMTFSWDGQWPLTSWQNTSLTIILMIICFYTAIQRGYSPVMLFNNRADRIFVDTLRKRFSYKKP
jgi:inner membrane protein